MALTTEGGIYKITNPINQVYIGATKNFRRRFANYKCFGCKTSRKIYQSLLQYGFENHTMELVHPLPGDVGQDDKDRIESIFISQYKELGFDMLNIFGGGKRNFTQDVESILLRSQSNTGKHRTEEQRKNMGRKTPVIISEEARQRLRERNTGKKLSAEHKAKISKGLLGKFVGKEVSEETRIKQREIAKKQWEDPEYRKKNLEKRKSYVFTDAHRKSISEALKKARKKDL